MRIETLPESEANLTDKHQDTKTRLIWDLTPRQEMGNLDGASARQWERVDQLIKVGALIRGEADEGIHLIKRRAGGVTYIEYTMACEPISLVDMIPNFNTAPKGYVTPLWPINRPDWLRE